MSKNFCFIPAKQNSTRLVGKNMKKINGKHLIGYAVENAIKSEIFSEKDIIVSSESEQMLSVARDYGASTPYVRDPKLSKDPAGVIDVLKNFLELFEEYKSYDSVVILQANSPLINESDIQQAHEAFMNTDCDVLLSTTPCEHSPFRAVRKNNDRLEFIFPEHINKKSQELEPAYRINGAVIIMNIKSLFKNWSFFKGKIGTYVIPPERGVDIDNKQDFHFVEFLMSKYQ